MSDHQQTIERTWAGHIRDNAAEFASYFADGGVLRAAATGEDVGA
jgi:hypothetical protein